MLKQKRPIGKQIHKTRIKLKELKIARMAERASKGIVEEVKRQERLEEGRRRKAELIIKLEEKKMARLAKCQKRKAELLDR